jgi:GT2 family glycosyltransferase
MDINTVEVAVIILTLNQREKTLRCLRSFQAVKHPPYRIVLWDNGSQDGTSEAVRQTFPDVLVHHHATNLGVASGRNAAVALAIEKIKPVYLLFIDNDMTVTPGFLEALVTPLNTGTQLAQTTGKIKDMQDDRRLYGAGGCRLSFWRGNTQHIGYGQLDRGQYDQAKRCIPSGGCMLVRTDIFRELGGFDTTFDPYGPEDLDFGLRVVKAGYYGLYVPHSVVFHETRPGRTFEGGHYTENFAAHRARHWFLLMRRHAPIYQQLGFWFLGAPYLLATLMIREGKKGNLLPALRGLTRGMVDFWTAGLHLK